MLPLNNYFLLLEIVCFPLVFSEIILTFCHTLAQIWWLWVEVQLILASSQAVHVESCQQWGDGCGFPKGTLQ